MRNRWLKEILANSFRGVASLCLALACASLLACGSLSPPAGIPSPVSNLMTASNPDTGGNVTLNGAPGSVLPNALVIAANASQGAMASQWKLDKWLMGVALAQTDSLVSQVTAGPDGSFTLVLQGQVGETLRITQTVDGQKSPPAELTIKGTVIDLGVAGRGVAVDETSSKAYVTGGNGAEGLVFDLDLSRNEPLPSLPDPFFTLAGLPNLGPISGDVEAQTALAISGPENTVAVFSLVPDDASLFTNSVTSPRGIDVNSGFNLAAIGVESALTSVSIHDTFDGSFECSFLIATTQQGSSQHVSTPFVRLGTDDKGVLQIVAVSRFSDGSWLLTRTALPSCFTAPIPNGTLIIPQLTEPAGLGIFNQATQAIISDSAGAQILVGNFSTAEFTAVPVGSVPKGVTVDEANGRAFIVNSGNNSITLLTLADLTTRKLVGVGLGPSELAVDAKLKRGLLISDLDETVVIVDLDIE